MALPLEFIIDAKNNLGAKLAEAGAQVRTFQAQVGSSTVATGAMAQASGLLSAGLVGLGVAAAAALGSIVPMVSAYSSAVEQLQNLAKTSGTSVQNLQTLRATLEDQGISAEAASSALFFLNKAIAEQDPLLKALHITTRDAYQAMLQLSDVFTASGDTATKSKVAQQLLGRGSRELISAMEGLRTATGATSKEIAAFGGTLDETAVATATYADAIFDMAGRRLGSIGLAIKKAAAEAFVFETVMLQSRFGGGARGAKVTDTEFGQYTSGAQAAGDALAAARKLIEEQNKKKGKKPEVWGDELNMGARAIAAETATRAYEDSKRFALPKEIEGVTVHLSELQKRAQDFKEQFQGGLREIGQTIRSSLVQGFVDVIMQAQNLRQALGGIFRSIVADILSVIARLAVTKFLGPLISSLGLAIGGPVGAVVGAVGAGMTGSNSLAPSGGDTFILQSLSQKDTLQSLTAPTGEFRRSNTRLREVLATR